MSDIALKMPDKIKQRILDLHNIQRQLQIIAEDLETQFCRCKECTGEECKTKV